MKFETKQASPESAKFWKHFYTKEYDEGYEHKVLFADFKKKLWLKEQPKKRGRPKKRL
jgi:hypothetical protein